MQVTHALFLFNVFCCLSVGGDEGRGGEGFGGARDPHGGRDRLIAHRMCFAVVSHTFSCGKWSCGCLAAVGWGPVLNPFCEGYGRGVWAVVEWSGVQ